MRSERGMTLTTVVVYVLAMVIIIGIVATVTTFFYANTRDMEKSAEALGEYNKFNMYFLGEIKAEGNKVEKVENGTQIIFSDGTMYTFTDGGIYRNKVKLCSNIVNCEFSLEEYGEKQIVKVLLEIGKNGEFVKTTEYIIGQGEHQYTSSSDYSDSKKSSNLIANPPNLAGFNINTTYYVTWEIVSPYVITDTVPISQPEPKYWHDYTAGINRWGNIKTTGNGNNCYWVWIPRYAYQVPVRSSTAQTINIKFLNGTTNVPMGEDVEITNVTPTVGSWVVHPAFTNAGNKGFGELEGIWVAKYEASSSSQTSNFVNNDSAFTTALADVTNYGGSSLDTDLQVRVVPNVVSWRHITVTNIFTVCKNLTTTNNSVANSTGIDSHMMKATEWGAVAYLSRSKYGMNGKVANNNYYHSSSYASITGVTTNSDTAVTSTSTLSKYNSDIGIKASTSGNVYGIYDMSGGIWEYLAGYVPNYRLSEAQNTNLNAANAKYKDIYTLSGGDTPAQNYDLNTNRYGDALYETSTSGQGSNSWDGDYSGYPAGANPILSRGGHSSSGSGAGLFSTTGASGLESNSIGFRPVIVIPNL